VSTRSKPDTRTRILLAAERLLIARGYHGVGLDEIAKAAGISRQALYQHHFKSKAELLLAMVAESTQRAGVQEATRPVFEAKDAVEALDLLVEAMVTVDGRIIESARVIDGARSTDSAAEAAWQDRMQSRTRFIRSVIDRVAEQGRLSPAWSPKEAAEFVSALISPSTYQAVIIERGWKPARYIAQLCHVLHMSLLSAPKRPRLTGSRN
jgi:AcrR family transcriptional regulator